MAVPDVSGNEIHWRRSHETRGEQIGGIFVDSARAVDLLHDAGIHHGHKVGGHRTEQGGEGGISRGANSQFQRRLGASGMAISLCRYPSLRIQAQGRDRRSEAQIRGLSCYPRVQLRVE
jgi:hypothetical protein